MSDIRYDRLHDTHVIISPERLHRPDCNFSTEKRKNSDKACPFCEGNETMTPPEIFSIRAKDSFANEKGWQTRVVPNLYKAVQIEAPYVHHFGLFEHWEGFGAHEVIIDTPEHHTSMVQWSKDNAVQWLKTLRSRTSDLRNDHRIAYISLFKNEGAEAGSTQAHSHTQLIGLPIIPKVQREEFQRSYEHYKHHEETILGSLLAHEEEDAQRIIAKTNRFTAYCPYASAYPFEVMITSQHVVGQIDTISDENIEQLAPLLLSVLKKMKAQLGCFDFNLCVSTPPLQEGSVGHELISFAGTASRFYIRIMPRIYKYGGFEQTTGMIINPVSPELAAKLLREEGDE
jgi:UDPglucose--hexose-1-phosphate uridylyltransferase